MSEENFTRLTTQDNFVSEKIDVIKNNLLGSYDDENEYFISPQIAQELKNLKKYRKSSYNNSNFCVGNLLGYGEIVFEIEFDEETVENNQAKANLYVLEDVDKINGYLQNVIKTKIGEFVAPLDDFIAKSYAFFNIYDDVESDEGKEKKSLDDLQSDDSFILAKKQFTLMLDKLSEDKFLDAYGKYFSKKISLLTATDNEFCKAVLEKFNEEYDMIEKLFLSNKDFRVLNELLDKCIESISGTKDIYIGQEQTFRESLAPDLEEFTTNVESLNDKFEEKALSMLSKDDKSKLQEMMESEEEHNRQIKEDDEESAVMENTDQTNQQVEEEKTQLSSNPFDIFGVDGLQEAENESEQSIEESSESEEQSNNDLDMDKMKSMFGIDPNHIDNRSVEGEETEQKESLDIMDMFRKKAEILATSPEYNGEESILSEQGDKMPSDSLQMGDSGKTEQEDVITDEIDTPSEQSTPTRNEQEVKNISDIFNTFKNLAKEKNGQKSEVKSPAVEEEKPVEETSFGSLFGNLNDNNSVSSHDDEYKDDEYSDTSSLTSSVSSFDKPPVFEDPSMIIEDEIYNDGLGLPLNFESKYDNSLQENSEEIPANAQTKAEITDEIGEPFSKSQDLNYLKDNSSQIDLNVM